MSDFVAPPTDNNIAPASHSELERIESRLAAIEYKQDVFKLSAEAQHRDLLIREIQQRIYVRYFAIAVGIFVMIFMGYVALHAVHHYFLGPIVVVPPAVAIAFFVTPIVSISSITIMLLVGAFRRFKDDDMDNVSVSSLASEAVKSVIGK